MSTFEKTDVKIINSALIEFKKRLKDVAQDSPDAYALTIFVNACGDTGRFQSNRFSALVQFPQARAAANELVGLLDVSPSLFNQAISSANSIMIDRRIVHAELCFG